VAAWFDATVADFQAVRAGWRQAWSEARRIAAGRPMVVATRGPDGISQLRSRLSIGGHAETHILRSWFTSADPQDIAARVAQHFETVRRSFGGLGALLALQRLLQRLIVLAGALIAALPSLVRLVRAPPRSWLDVLLAHPWLWLGLGMMLAGVVLRIVLRWTVRLAFRRALGRFVPS